MELKSSEWLVLRVNQEEIEEGDVLWIINKSTTRCALDLGRQGKELKTESQGWTYVMPYLSSRR